MLLSFVFLAIGLSIVTTRLTSVPVFADKEKNQKLSSNIKDGTVISNPPPNGGTDSFKVVSTDSSDGDDNVPTDLSEIKVTFNKKIEKITVDTGSLALFADNCSTDICNNPTIQDVSVSSKSVVFTIDNNDRFTPDTNYIASLLSSIKDEDGNFLDCANSKGVDDNCEWNFSTSGSSSNPTISINPTSGPVGTSVTVTGNGFAPISSVAITFGGNTVNTNPATVTTSANGEFNSTFSVPQSSNGDHTVRGAQASNTASAPFTVTSSSNLTALSSPNSSENKIIPNIFG